MKVTFLTVRFEPQTAVPSHKLSFNDKLQPGSERICWNPLMTVAFVLAVLSNAPLVNVPSLS